MNILALTVMLISLVCYVYVFRRWIPLVKMMRTVAHNVALKAAVQTRGVSVASQC